MLPGGIILIVLAVVALFVGRSQAARANAAKGTETQSCADINALSSGVSAEVGGGQRRRNRVERTEAVSNITSAQPFRTGAVAVAPDGADVDQPERVLDRFEPHVESQPLPSGLMGLVGSVLRSGASSGTLGFEYEEWVIRPGARLYVHGEVTDASGRVAFAKPDKGRYVISTRSEEQIVGAAERGATIARTITGVLAVAGVALVVAGLLS